MSKVLRKTQRIFGFFAPAADGGVAQFGSLAAGTPVFSKDPEVIQALSNYLDGWSAAIIGSSNPAIEDENALDYVFSYQLAYLMQNGIPEWNVDTPYFVGSLATDGTGVIYVSLTNTNEGNALTNTANWRPLLGFSRNADPVDIVVPSGYTYFKPRPTIPLGTSWVVASGGFLEVTGPFQIDGTLTVNGTSRVL